MPHFDPLTLDGRLTELQYVNAELNKEIERLRAEVDALQAKIDALMLEYCPEEMTPEQVAAYEAAQRPVDEAQIARIDAAMKGEQA